MPERIIAVDIGCALTRACLFSVVEGTYRLTAASQAVTGLRHLENGIADVVLQAIRRIEQATHLPLLAPAAQGRLLRQLLPETVLTVCTSAAEPLRVVILGMTPTYSLAAARLACHLPFVHIIGTQTITLHGKADEGAAKLLPDTVQPDVILLTGGFHNAVDAPFERIARLLLEAFEHACVDQRPRIMLAVNQASQRSIVSLLGPAFDLRLVRNLCPAPDALDIADTQQELVTAYEQLKIPELPGYHQLASLCARPIISTWRALDHALGYYPDMTHLAALGSAAAGVYSQTVSGGYLLAGSPLAEVASGKPAGAGSASLVETTVQVKSASESLEQSANTRVDYDKPADLAPQEQLLIKAVEVMRPSIERGFLTSPGNADLFVVHVEQPTASGRADAILTVLDSLQPVGVSRLIFYQSDVLPHIGTAALPYPQTAELLLQPELQEHGICFAPIGTPRRQCPALEICVSRADGREERFVVPANRLHMVKFPPN